jgi:hypothetical protein
MSKELTLVDLANLSRSGAVENWVLELCKKPDIVSVYEVTACMKYLAKLEETLRYSIGFAVRIKRDREIAWAMFKLYRFCIEIRVNGFMTRYWNNKLMEMLR